MEELEGPSRSDATRRPRTCQIREVSPIRLLRYNNITQFTFSFVIKLTFPFSPIHRRYHQTKPNTTHHCLIIYHIHPLHLTLNSPQSNSHTVSDHNSCQSHATLPKTANEFACLTRVWCCEPKLRALNLTTGHLCLQHTAVQFEYIQSPIISSSFGSTAPRVSLNLSKIPRAQLRRQ